ncbi:MAG: hypothetical protein ACP5N1_06560 [Candidatus Woesearchaeota archaeon]
MLFPNMGCLDSKKYCLEFYSSSVVINQKLFKTIMFSLTMLKNVTDIEINKHVKSEFYEFSGFILRDKLSFFKADNIDDVLENYDFLSQGQYKPLILDFRKMCSNEEELIDYELGASLIFATKVMSTLGSFGHCYTPSSHSIYDDFFRNKPVDGSVVLPPKLVEIKNLSYPCEIFLKHDTESYKIYATCFQEFLGKDVHIVSVSKDLHGHKGHLGEFNPDEYFTSTLLNKSLEEITKLDNYENLKYTGLFQVLPRNYDGAKAFFTSSNYSLRLYQLELDDSEDERDSKSVPTPSERLNLVFK